MRGRAGGRAGWSQAAAQKSLWLRDSTNLALHELSSNLNGSVSVFRSLLPGPGRAGVIAFRPSHGSRCGRGASDTALEFEAAAPTLLNPNFKVVTPD